DTPTDIPAAPTATSVMPTVATEINPLPLTLRWQPEFLVITNNRDNNRNADFSELVFSNEGGIPVRLITIIESNAVANIRRVEPGDCVVVYNLAVLTERPSIETIRNLAYCNDVIAYAGLGENIFWS